jgi:citrate synthase
MTLAAGPEAFQGAVAAGLLGCGSVILGSSQAAGEFLSAVVVKAADGDLADAAMTTISTYRASGRAIPGYGHPLHKAGDPRATRLFAIAREAGTYGLHCEAAHVAESLMPELTKRNLAMNISAAIPAVLLDAGYPLLALKGVPLLARTASLVAHLLEELTHPIGFHMAHAASSAISYDGPAPEGFVPNEK